MVKKFLDYISYRILLVLFNHVKKLDLDGARRVGERLTIIWYLIDVKRKNLARRNVMNSLEVSESRAEEIVRDNFAHYGKMIGEIGKWEYIYENADSFFELHDFHHVEKLKEELKGKGFIVLTGHIGNWEIASIAFTRYIGKGTAIVKKIHNQYLNEFITDMRTRMGLDLISDKNTVFSMMKKIRKGEILVFLLDQNAPVQEAVFVNFFGRPASTFKVVAMLSLKFNIPVLPAYCIRNDEGKFDIYFDDPIYPVKGDDLESDIVRNTQLYTNFIEETVRKYPEQWFWVHNRWKNQPEGVKESEG